MSIPTTTVISPRLDSYPQDYLPESDGKPMAETDRHRKLMLALLHALDEYYRDHPQVYVSGNIFIYYRIERIINAARCQLANGVFVLSPSQKNLIYCHAHPRSLPVNNLI